MNWLRIFNQTRNVVLAERAGHASTFWRRFRGLMFAPGLPAGGGLLLEPCNSIHMLFMRFSIDAVFIDVAGLVVAAVERLWPFVSIAGPYRTATRVLELPAGMVAATGTSAGDQCVIETLPS